MPDPDSVDPADASDPTARITERLRRLLFPLIGAQANAAEALESFERTPVLVLQGADLGLVAGHPSGRSPRRAARRLESGIWDAFPAMVALLDGRGTVVSVNAAWRRFGLENGGAPACGLGADYLALCDGAAAEGEPEAAEAAALVRAALRGDGSVRPLRYACSPGRWFNLQAIPIPGVGSGALVVHTDITASTRETERWRHQALHDPLTGLPNRALLEDRLQHAVSAAARTPRSVAAIFLDLNGFKRVNDTYGHAAGDRVLTEAALRMTASVREGDTLGRWGGDEFLVVAERLEHPEVAVDLADRIRSSLGAPIEIGPTAITVGVSAGVAHLAAGQTAGSLIEAADRALQISRDDRPR